MTVPSIRCRALNQESLRADGDYVLYWMTAFRRARYNFSLERAIQLAEEHRKPLVVLEALRCDYPWASERIHRFVLEGMRDNEQAFANTSINYYPYVESKPGDGRGLIESLASAAVAVVTDDFPCFFLRRMTHVVGARLPVAAEAVDSNGIYPMRATDREFTRAHSFRRHLQKELLPHLASRPLADPLESCALPTWDLPPTVRKQWPAADLGLWCGDTSPLAKITWQRNVPRGKLTGGSVAAGQRWLDFLESKLANYGERNQPDQAAASGLSPYLHFGHISPHELLDDLIEKEAWTPERLAPSATGSANGWWGLSEPGEGFLDELITWRELGYNLCSLRDDYDQYESLPQWAQKTLEEHTSDPRDYTYDLETFADSATHDEVWNAAQRQLVREGVMHNYLRMLWGKKILEWTPTPRDALQIMIELNNRYALDGRNPNSYSGIFWVLGRYDRAWGPERPIFGKIRYMSSDNTKRKLRLKSYLSTYGPDAPARELFPT